METTHNSHAAIERGPSRPNVLLLGAAVSVMILSAVAIAAMTGLIPSAWSERGEARPDAAAGASATPAKPAAARPRTSGGATTAAVASCGNCGTVESIRAVEVRGDASGVGAVAGGLTGAVIGNQMGRGHGNTAMTILGAAGGAYAGNEIEKNMNKRLSYRVTVRMDDGSYRTLSLAGAPGVAVGDKVRVVDGALVARS